MDIRDPELISILNNECDILIDGMSIHDSGYVDLTYDFNFSPESLENAHIRKKRIISKAIKNHVDEETYKIIRIYNKELNKTRITPQYTRGEKKFLYQQERGNNSKRKKNLAFMPTTLVNCSLPTKKEYITIVDKKGNMRTVESNEHVTKNGNEKLYMSTFSEIGLPFGPIARLIISYATTQVLLTGDKRIFLGKCFSEFMRRVGYEPKGGERGNIKKFKDQLIRLSACQIVLLSNNKKRFIIKGLKIIDESYISLDSNNDNSFFKENDYFDISDDLYKMLTDSNVPYDKDVMNIIKHNPLMMDIYIWATYKCYKHKNRMLISWDDIKLQFGSSYKRATDFRKNFMKTVKKLDEIAISGITYDKQYVFINPNAKGLARISRR